MLAAAKAWVVSQADRDRWNARYGSGAYAEREHPSALLEVWLPKLLAARSSHPASVPRALDVACGAGRNSLWLARQGFAVTGVDISDAALEIAAARAAAQGLTVDLQALDLEAGLPANLGSYDLIVVMRYLDRALFARLPERLNPGGYIICEVHLESAAEVIGPRGSAFRAAPGELAAAFGGIEVVAAEEGVFTDPDGRPAALARLVARRIV